jgi:predicted thioesterase
MELLELIHLGMTSEEIFLVEERHLATHVGSGAAQVLATPWMIAFMEGVSHRLLAKYLPAGYSSVGAHIDVHHLAPTPLGCSVRIRTEVREVQGFRVTFSVQAWDDQEQVGDGLHERVVIDEARFLKRVEAKR